MITKNFRYLRVIASIPMPDGSAISRGFFVTFEGVEGSGKTTQIKHLERFLLQKGWRCTVTREPGGSPLGDRIRRILLSSDTRELTALGELFLYEAARAEHVAQVIRPALRGGGVVLCDRFCDATVAYQGYARRLDLATVKHLNRLASEGTSPDLTLLLDCPVEVGLGRASRRIKAKSPSAREDRFERESLHFHQRVREGYLRIAREDPDRIRVIDASQGELEVHRLICGIVEPRLRGAVNRLIQPMGI